MMKVFLEANKIIEKWVWLRTDQKREMTINEYFYPNLFSFTKGKG